MLRWRILLGAVLIAAVVALLHFDAVHGPTLGLPVIALVVGLAAAQECVQLFARGDLHPLPGVIYAGTLAVIGINLVPLFYRPLAEDRPLERLAWPLLAYTGTVLAALLGEMRRYRQPGGVMVNVALAVFAVAYCGLLWSFVLQLRFLGGSAAGMMALVGLFVVVKLADIGAYTVGRLFGRNKMAPVLSPGKTLEGAAGAMVFACLGAWLTFRGGPEWLQVNLAEASPSMGFVLTFGVVVGAAGMMGDLAESLFKRDMGAKDSSTWLPGFGGVLDLLDSILLAAPVAYVCWWLRW